MFKTFKEWLEAKGVNEEAYTSKTAEEMAKLQKEYMQYVSEEMKKATENGVSKNYLEEITKGLVKEDAIKGFLTKESEEFKNFEQRIKEAEEKAAQAIEGISGSGPVSIKSIKEQIVSQIKERQSEFDALKENKNASFTVTIKAPANMLTSSNLTPAGNRIARTENDGVVDFVKRNPFLLDIVNVSSTNAKTIYWVEKVSKDGGPAMTAEGAVKPQMDWDYVENSTEVRKIPVFVKASKEMLDDVDGFAADIEQEIREDLALFLDGQLLTADGTGINLIGLDANAVPFAAGSLANTIEGANDTDALRSGIAHVRRSEFIANAILLNPDKAASMDLQKGSDGHYLLPPFVTADGQRVSGVRVVENTGVPADDFYVGDFTKFKFKVREEITIQYGYSGDDWIRNMITPLGEMRGASYIPTNHFGAIIKGSFTTAKAALETP
ncbi:MAG: phage major capsid protein [Bacteroidota bacterium]